MYLIIMALIVVIVIAVSVIIINSTSATVSPLDLNSQFNSDLKIINEVMIQDAHLHRLLMIETDHEEMEETSYSSAVTFNEMAEGMALLGKSLIKSLGSNIAHRIANLMQSRNDILRDYYRSLYYDETVYFLKSIDLESTESTTEIDDICPRSKGSDIIRKLENIDRQIVDTITASFHIRDANPNKNDIFRGPIIRHERLFNLLSMYDRELINQANLYSSHQYNRSMNCNQSLLDIANHISDEFNLIMKDSQNLINQVPGRIFDPSNITT